VASIDEQNWVYIGAKPNNPEGITLD
jgi:hypothetical protein